GIALVAASFIPGLNAVVATLIRTVGVNTALSGAAAALAPRPKRQQAAVKAVYSGGVNHQPLVFGEVQIGGQLGTIGHSGDRGTLVHWAFMHSLAQDGGIDSVPDIWLDDNLIPAADIDGG